jgi:hypothetical protein
MTTTELERRQDRDVALFPGSNSDEILAVAADVATKFGDVVKKQRMFKRIGDNDHIQIEAWQTIGALTGVVAPHGEVEQLTWPALEPIGAEPPLPGREPRNRDSDEWRTWKRADRIRAGWELHEDMLRARSIGRAYGFVARFNAAKNGSDVGWGEGRCTRGEAGKTNQDDYALSSMAQTRAQSRALGAPLKFVVKLAGYETTPAEELDGAGPDAGQAARIAELEREPTAAHDALAKAEPATAGDISPAQAAAIQPHGPVTDDDDLLKKAAESVKQIAGPVPVDAERFVLAMGEHFDGVPVASITMLRGLARFIGDARAGMAGGGGSPEDAPPERQDSAYHTHPTAEGDPGGRRYHGD